MTNSPAINSLAEILPYWSFDEKTGLFINKNGYGFVLELSPLLGFSQRIESEIAGLFKTTLPENSNVQFLMLASPKIGDCIDKWQSTTSASGVLADLVAKRAEYLKGFAYKTPLVRHYRLFLSYSVPMQAKVISEYDKKMVMDLRDTVRTLFSSIGLV